MCGFAHLSVLLYLFKMKQDGPVVPEIKGAAKIYPPFKFSVLQHLSLYKLYQIRSLKRLRLCVEILELDHHLKFYCGSSSG